MSVVYVSALGFQSVYIYHVVHSVCVHWSVCRLSSHCTFELLCSVPPKNMSGKLCGVKQQHEQPKNH